ncbi:2'-5' RNA ligase superfamily protein [Palleronia aestuarii]|uniref:2'-5' RNA ligase superfamily protein n=1 Tax=Palleronia aestuarii TaxID=568105 RepID=A0A2W7QDI5_9RHOB|nr:2'-5' RNA ligase family protein [Palleronia aestuarii]PZX19929.1 2'-5' RNA ligase superfamily protein [Palleronia aestuarii]
MPVLARASRLAYSDGMALILTFGFDSASFARLEALRQRYFPPARNFIPAHLTLFQQLPEHAMDDLLATLARTAKATAPLPFTATGILDFGGGAAIALDAPGAGRLQGDLRTAWEDVITASDDRARKLHVTVQNKVDRETAKATQATLRAGFAPWDGVLDRLILWHYRGGPWERIATCPLRGETP